MKGWNGGCKAGIGQQPGISIGAEGGRKKNHVLIGENSTFGYK